LGLYRTKKLEIANNKREKESVKEKDGDSRKGMQKVGVEEREIEVS
jgi:hypothetical protein